MAEYIEREATCGDCIHADVCERNPLLTKFSRENPAYCVNFKDVADVVEVVRCSECKHCIWSDETEDIAHAFCTTYGCETLDDDFCSYGERRADNA